MSAPHPAFDDHAAFSKIDEADLPFQEKFLLQTIVAVAKYAHDTDRPLVRDGLIEVLEHDFDLGLCS